MRLTIPITGSLSLTFAFFLLSVALYLTPTHAQQVSTPPQKQTTGTGPINLTAKSANVSESGIPIKVSIFRWSTDEERNPLVVSLDPAAREFTFYEVGQDVTGLSDPFESYLHFATKVINEYERMSQEFAFIMIDAERPIYDQHRFIRHLYETRLETAFALDRTACWDSSHSAESGHVTAVRD